MANILVVDDVEDNVLLLNLILENYGHTTNSAYGGKEALDIAFREDFDLIILDVMMPIINGLEVARRLKANDKTRHIPIILLTALKNDSSDVIKGLNSGADEYIRKPFTEPEIIARVNSMLRIKALYDQVAASKAIIDEELKTAQAVQKSLLPEKFPQPDKFKCAARYRATYAIGGDFYDTFDYGDGKIGVMIADVSGHGPSAALIVSMLKVMVEHCVAEKSDPVEIAQQVNEQMLAITPEEQYVTMFYGIVDLVNSKLTYVRAGHPYPFIMRAADRSFVKLDAPGELVGLFDEFHVEKAEIDLQPGDRIFAYSDGIIEVIGSDGDLYGMDRLISFLSSRFEDDFDELLDGVIKDAEEFNSADSFEDDVALIMAKIL